MAETLDPQIELVMNLVKTHCPVMFYHPKEQFYPCSAQWFIDRSQLIQHNDAEPEKKILQVLTQKGKVTFQGMVEKSQSMGSVRLDLADIASRAGEGAQGEIDDVPLYVYYKIVDDEAGRCVEINYMMLYAHNGEYVIGPGFGLGVKAGSHDGDWEHLTIRCELPTGTLIGAYYSSHRSSDGEWVRAKDLPRDPETGAIACYVALNGHGLYFTTKTHFRIFGLANDVTSNKGKRWSPKKCVVLRAPAGRALDGGLPVVKGRDNVLGSSGDSERAVHVRSIEPEVHIDSEDWHGFNGRWGSVVTPTRQRWFKEAEHPRGSNAFLRCLLPWVRTV